MNEFIHELKINRERVAVLIGKEGTIKREIEKATKTKLKIDSKEGDVFVSGTDGLGVFTATEVIKAIGRGFNPEVSLLLLKQEYSFEVLNLTDYCGDSKKALMRIKGRIIGAEGKSRKYIEQLTDTYISVFGKTVAIIGETSNVIIAREAVGSLAQGSPHSRVYRWLEKKHGDLKRQYFLGEDIEFREEKAETVKDSEKE